MKWTRLLIGFCLVTSVVLGVPQALSPKAVARKPFPASPPGRIWVINANVREQEVRDSRHHADMREFLSQSLGRDAPDVVLLQQVNRHSTRWLRRGYTERTRNTFRIVKGPSWLRNSEPGESVRKEVPGGFLRRDDSAILVNTSTMRVISSGKVIISQRRSAAKGTPKQQVVPWARLAERGHDPDLLQVTTTSIHYPTHGSFQNRRLSFQHKRRWSSRLSRLLNSKMRDRASDNKIATLIGDFNATRCVHGTSIKYNNCHRTLFWKRMMKMGYGEALHAGEYGDGWRRHMIDFIFHKGNVSSVFYDYWPKGIDDYSDHGVAGALLEEEDKTPPFPPHRIHGRYTEGDHPRLFVGEGRYGGWDGGSGWKGWRIFRRTGEVGEWDQIAVDRGRYYVDREVTVTHGDTYQYLVDSVDRVGNASNSLGPITFSR